jgi:hypothetical protein
MDHHSLLPEILRTPAACADLPKNLPEAVTQDQLQRYLDLKPLADEFERLREALRSALDGGAAVEPGPLAARLDVEYKSQLTVRHVLTRLGVPGAVIQELKRSAPPLRYRYLIVSESAPAAGQSGLDDFDGFEDEEAASP